MSASATDRPSGTLPAYRIPLPSLAMFALDLITGRRRSFAGDGGIVVRTNARHRRVIEGIEHAPRTGTFILVMNHFSRAGLRPYHCAFIVAEALARHRPGEPEMRWALTSEYLGRRIGPVPIPLWLIRWVFRRVAVVYGFVVIARREALVMGRAAALRDLARTAAHQPVGLTPEGVAGSGRLVQPPPGNGLFLASLARGRIPLLPAGVWEDEDGALHVRFGEPFALGVSHGVPREEQDRIARERVMLAIGRLLPRAWWGAYEPQLAARAAT